jgi:hypothetical protein
LNIRFFQNPLELQSITSSVSQEIADAINAHELGLDVFGLGANMHRDMVRRLFASVGYPLKVKRGRCQIEDTEKIANRVQKFYDSKGISCGDKRVTQSICLPASKPPYDAVHRALHPEPLPHETQRVEHPNSFGARYRDFLWHTDVHVLQHAPQKAT